MTHSSALAMTVERETGPESAAAAIEVRSGSEGRCTSVGAEEQPTSSSAEAGRVQGATRVGMGGPYAADVPGKNPPQNAVLEAPSRVAARGASRPVAAPRETARGLSDRMGGESTEGGVG